MSIGEERHPLATNPCHTERLKIPVCSDCQRRNRTRYWRVLLKTMALAVVGVTVFSFLLGLILDLLGATPGPGAMTVLLTLSGLLCSLGLSWFFAIKRARAVSAPFHLADYNPSDGTIRLRFRNAKFTELFLACATGNVEA